MFARTEAPSEVAILPALSPPNVQMLECVNGCLFPKCSHFNNAEFKCLIYSNYGVPLAPGYGAILISPHYRDPLAWGLEPY